MTGPYGQAARLYQAAGWSPLPLPATRKKPPPAGWTGRGAQRASAADVETWCEEHANGNVALWLHLGRIGIDVDAWKGPAEAAAWAQLVERCGPLPEDAPWCTSRDDGVSGIRLCAVPAGYEAVTDLGLAGEVIQHFHRYVVAPPSIHPDTGQPYRWINLPEGRVPEAAHLPMLPEPWLDHLRAGNGSAAGSSVFQQPARSDWTSPNVSELATGGIPPGANQDKHLRDLVFECVRNGMSEPACQAVWEAAVARTPLQRPREPWTATDFQRHYRGATRKATQPATHPDHADHPQSAAESGNGRMQADAGDRNPVDIADGIAGRLVSCNTPPRLFSMGMTAAELDADGKLRPLDPDGWLYYVASRVDFIARRGSKGERTVAPPAAVMKLIPPATIPKLPQLDGITTVPYLARDGSLISQDGYNPQTRLILHSSVPALQAAQRPGPEDVAQAVKLLTEDWLGDFPFAAPADKAAVIAILLTLTGRAFFSLAPLFVIDASTAGSGKGLIVKTISLIVTGEPGDVMELPADGEEQRKKVTSVLLAGKDLVMWDESHVIAGRTLAAILTAEVYSDRLLGGNKLVSVVNRFTQVALGNNIEVWGDMKRRIVPARLVPDTEHPEHRDDFRHPDLENWVKQNRGELLAAVLTIWRNWIVRGRPEAATGMGSFDRWARTVGGALEAAGITGFRSNTATWLSDSEDDDGWHDHLAQLRTNYSTGAFTVADVTNLIESATSLMKRPAAIRLDKDKTLGQQLGYAYRKIRDRWHGDLRLIRSEDRDSPTGGRTWTVDQRGDNRRSEPAQPSSVSSVSSDSQVSDGPRFQQPALTMPDGRASSVADPGSESPGQASRADHTDDTDHRYPDPEPAAEAARRPGESELGYAQRLARERRAGQR